MRATGGVWAQQVATSWEVGHRVGPQASRSSASRTRWGQLHLSTDEMITELTCALWSRLSNQPAPPRQPASKSAG